MPAGRPLRHHPRRRHAAAARRRATPGRHDGAPAEPAASSTPAPAASSTATRCCSRGSRRRCPRIATARSSSGSSPGPAAIDPYASAVSDVYQDLFGEGSYTGKGIYDVDAFERGARRTRPGERAPQPRSLRGPLRARRARHRHRALRGVPGPLRGRGRAPAPLGARRLAAPALDAPGRHPRGSAADLDPADRPLEDARQPAPDPVGARRRAHRCSSAGCSRRPPARVDGVRPRHHRAAGAPPRVRRASFRSGGHLQAEPPARRRRGPRDRGVPDRARHHLPRPPGVADERRDRAHARAPLRHAPAPARVGDRGAGQVGRSIPDSPAFYRRMGGGVVLAAAAGALVVLVAAGQPRGLAAPFLAALGLSPAVARRISLPPRAVAPATALAGGRARRCARPPAAPGASSRPSSGRRHVLPPDNFQEDPRAGRRAPHVADQHRPLPARDGRGPRLRLDRASSTWSSASRRRSRRCARLERFRGHLYNWYDTTDLRPLEPRYVSTVDSGNLAGHLIAARASVPRARSQRPLPHRRLVAGIDDALQSRCGSRRRRSRTTAAARRVTVRAARRGARRAWAPRSRRRRTRRTRSPSADSRGTPTPWWTSRAP